MGTAAERPEEERPGEEPAGDELSLVPGLERSDVFDVEGRLVTNVGGTIEASVLSTPGMISMMEACATALAYAHLPADWATVGVEFSVKHVAAAAEGSTCQVRAILRRVIDAEKLQFEVEVTEGERTIGVGAHERRIVEPDRLGSAPT